MHARDDHQRYFTHKSINTQVIAESILFTKDRKKRNKKGQSCTFYFFKLVGSTKDAWIVEWMDSKTLPRELDILLLYHCDFKHHYCWRFKHFLKDNIETFKMIDMFLQKTSYIFLILWSLKYLKEKNSIIFLRISVSVIHWRAENFPRVCTSTNLFSTGNCQQFHMNGHR